MKGRKPKLTRADCENIRRIYREQPPMHAPQIARLYRVTASTIHKVLNGKYTWREEQELNDLRAEVERQRCPICDMGGGQHFLECPRGGQ